MLTLDHDEQLQLCHLFAMQRNRGSGRVRGSANVGGRGHGSTRGGKTQPRGGRGRGSHELGTRLPNRSRTAAILALGLSLVGFCSERQGCSEGLCIRRFRGHYGVGPAAIKALVADLRRHQPQKNLDESSLFMAVSWLKLYDTEEVMAGRWGYGEKYCRETVRDYVSRIQALKPLKISFDGLPSSVPST